MTSEFPFDRSWSLPDAVQLACLLEASAPKAGNVHPAADFADMGFAHFLASSIAVRACFDSTPLGSVGQIVLNGVRRTQDLAGRNTNLGTLLLFAPIAKAFESSRPLRESIPQVLGSLTSHDCRHTYQAIRLAQPGGLGEQPVHDIEDSPPEDLIDAMAQVADFDAVARQYATGFVDIFDKLLPWFEDALGAGHSPLEAICRLQLRWLAHEEDSLVIRKLGKEPAGQIKEKAARVWRRLADYRGNICDEESYRELDLFLRQDSNSNRSHARNPGTTADLIAATLLIRLLQIRVRE